MPDYIGGYEVGPMVAYQGKEGCSDAHCTRARNPVTGEWDNERCMGYHCPRCHAPTGMMGHRNCPKLDPRT